MNLIDIIFFMEVMIAVVLAIYGYFLFQIGDELFRMIAQFSTSFMKGKPTKEETMTEKIIGVVACVAYVCIIAGIYAYGSIEAARRDAHLQ